jgi:hypothetical protein
MTKPRVWPVSLRPVRGELLYSWMARVAAVYGVAPHELLPETVFAADALPSMVQEAGPHILKTLSAFTGASRSSIAKLTLVGGRPYWLPDWVIAQSKSRFSTMPSLQVCPQCLSDDTGTSGIQYLRLRWQSAVMTLCPMHLLPLEQTCICCHRIGWPVCERTIFRRFRFFCSHCSSPQEMSRWIGPEPNSPAVRLLICFEKQLLAALANRAVEWSWIGQATPGEFQRLVADLLWALTSYGYGAKPIHRLQTSAFPLSSRSVPNPETKHWRFASPADRRCLFASALSIFGRPSVSQILHGSAARCEQLGGWLEFALSLTQKHIRDLERRSWYWPPTAHNAFRRAILLAQSGSRIPFHAGRSMLPISGKLRPEFANSRRFY